MRRKGGRKETEERNSRQTECVELMMMMMTQKLGENQRKVE